MTSKIRPASLMVGGLLAFAAGVSRAEAPPAPLAPRPVMETLWGRSVTDDYRFMEQGGPAFDRWLRAQGDHTRRVLNSIAPLDALRARVAALSGGFTLFDAFQSRGARAFFLRRTPGAEGFDLVTKDAAGERILVDIAAIRAANAGASSAVSWFLPSSDGARVAAGISAGGSEDASLFVYDVATGRPIGGPIDRARLGATTWSLDGREVYFVRLKPPTPGMSPRDRLTGSTVEAWDLVHEPRPVAGAAVNPSAAMGPDEIPSVIVSAGSQLALLTSTHGVQNEKTIWTAPASSALDPATPWRRLAQSGDGVTAVQARGDHLYLLSHRGAPTFEVLHVKAGEPLSRATVLVGAREDRVIDEIHAASDGLYVLARRGAYSELLRVPAGGSAAETVELPFHGHVAEAFSDPSAPGLSIFLSGWTTPATEYRYDPASGRFTDLRIGGGGGVDPAQFRTQDLLAMARDGVKVPLSLVQLKGATKPGITVIDAYGAYGISNLANFSARRTSFVKEGINYAICHVRGGGELGEAWRLAGKDANKPNTWRDLIACADDVVARKIATPKSLVILGGSAGGLAVGRAMEERPDLFAGVIDFVPLTNPLRFEFSPGGPLNIPEFGSITTKAGFDNLYEMDVVAHVRKGVVYPAILMSTGLNDPRVPPWQPGKLAAALQTSGTPNPVLLRVDEQAGHGLGSSKSQIDGLTADWIAFVLWRAGRPGWAPSNETR